MGQRCETSVRWSERASYRRDDAVVAIGRIKKTSPLFNSRFLDFAVFPQPLFAATTTYHILIGLCKIGYYLFESSKHTRSQLLKVGNWWVQTLESTLLRASCFHVSVVQEWRFIPRVLPRKISFLTSVEKTKNMWNCLSSRRHCLLATSLALNLELRTAVALEF